MSSLHITGFFDLFNGHRETVTKNGRHGNKINLHFLNYDSLVDCTHDVGIPASIHYSCDANEEPLHDGTVAYVIAKGFMSPEGTFFMHVLHLLPVPGNPDDDSYKESLPAAAMPFVFGVGRVTQSDVPTALLAYKAFEVTFISKSRVENTQAARNVTTVQ